MGYSTSPKTVIKFEAELKQILSMFKSNRDECVLMSNAPKKYAYQIREAMSAAESLNLPELKSLSNNIQIKELSDRIIVKKLKKERPCIVVDIAENEFDVVEYIIENIDNLKLVTVLFPSVLEEAKSHIAKYCEANNLVMIELEKGIKIEGV